ncbi:MAG: outer membrane lipoprotein carrier protein LolA [Bacteroidaceae bacterium]|nr:outer membrane lipoprotein carrier protein LolA [Bacteroidaceae bacterium]
MKNVKYLLLLLAVMFQLPLFSQKVAVDANAVLDKSLASLKSSLPVRMDYDYVVFDDNDEQLQRDKGFIYMDNNRYALLMQDMKVWCDGTTQWSYMREVDEIYVTDADSDEAQNLSPLYVMEHYREGFSASAVNQGGVVTVTLQAVDGDTDVENVQLLILESDYRLVAMVISMSGQGGVLVELDGYVAKCGVGDDVYRCPVDEFAGCEIIDMR